MKQLKISNRITKRESLAIDKYLNDISKIELLQPEEEFELASRIRDGDQQALETLIRANLRFVVSVAKQYQNQGLSLPDLINEGNVGLMKAAKRFDASKGFKFISYAVWWIRQSILQAILEYSRLVRLPLNKVTLYQKVRNAQASFLQEMERKPSIQELADAVNATTQEVENILENAATHLSFDAPVSDTEESATLIDLYMDDDMETPDWDLINESLQKELVHGLSILSPREAEVLRYYFGLEDNVAITLDEIGERMNLTRERVRQLKERGLRRLRKKLNHNRLRTYLG